MPRVLHDPRPGYYQGAEEYADKIYWVRKAKSGNWYAMLFYRRTNGTAGLHYVGHRVKLGERIVL